MLTKAGVFNKGKRLFYGIHIRFFIWCTLLSATLLIVVSLIAAQQTADGKRADIDRQMNTMVQFMNDTLDNYFDDLRATLITVAINPDLRRILDGRFTDDNQKYHTYTTYNRLVGSIIATRKYNQLYLILPTRGQILSTNVKHSTDQFSMAASVWMQTLIKSESNFTVLHSFQPDPSQPVDLAFALAFRIDPYEQEQPDYLLVSVDQGWFIDSFGGVVGEAIRSCQVTTASGTVLYQTGDMSHLKNAIPYSHTSPSTGCEITIWYDIASIQMAQRSEMRVVLLGLLASIILAFIISYTISWRLNKPIRQLKLAMERMEQDDYSARIGFYSNDEIGEIGHRFDRMADRIRILIDEVYAGELLWRETELLALQQQINPHFLYNTLEVINALANRGDGPSIRLVVQKLSSLFRYNMNTGLNQTVLLSDELQHAEDYIDIQRIRLGGMIEAHFTVLEGLDRCMTLKFIIQPILENSISHGFAGMKEKGIVTVKVWREGDTVHIRISDNGRGLTDNALAKLRNQLEEQPNLLKKADGKPQMADENIKIGLTNVNSRLKLRYGDACGLRVDHAPEQGLQVEMIFPFQWLEVGEHAHPGS